jgi:hypothetical protein
VLDYKFVKMLPINDKDEVNFKNIEIIITKYYKVVDYKYVKILPIINISLIKKMNFVTPILNVSRKLSMFVIFSTGYIKIYNNKTPNEYHIQS